MQCSAASGRRFVVDLAGAEFIDSSALGMLLLLREMTDATGADVEIVNTRPEVLKILHTAKFEQLFKIA
ncbi:MAG: STAS domain-containing protein [Magnetococcus sp. YQC-5]